MKKSMTGLFSSALLLSAACSGNGNDFQGSDGGNHLSFDDQVFEVESVYCSERMQRVTARFATGVLYVNRSEESPGFEAILRFTQPERSGYINTRITDQTGNLQQTDGLHLDIERGVHGSVGLTRTYKVLNPESFPDASLKTLTVQAACPG